MISPCVWRMQKRKILFRLLIGGIGLHHIYEVRTFYNFGGNVSPFDFHLFTSFFKSDPYDTFVQEQYIPTFILALNTYADSSFRYVRQKRVKMKPMIYNFVGDWASGAFRENVWPCDFWVSFGHGWIIPFGKLRVILAHQSKFVIYLKIRVEKRS